MEKLEVIASDVEAQNQSQLKDAVLTKTDIVCTQTEVSANSSLDQQSLPRESHHPNLFNVTCAALKNWSAEILSCAVSLAALIAIFGVLLAFHGHPLPRWPKGISINTVIAIFTVIQKAGLLAPVTEGICQLKWRHFQKSQSVADIKRFDAASRGATGSAMLLFRHPRNFLSALGALLMIAALGVDPFSQQVIQYVSCKNTMSNGAASIARANAYYNSGLHVSASMSALDRPMTGAVYRGIFNPPSDPSTMIPFHCSTGNCTFTSTDEGVTHWSLGLCHSFTEINDTVQLIEVPLDSDMGFAMGSYILPSGLFLNGTVRQTLSVMDVSTNYTANVFTFETLMLRYSDCTNDDISKCMIDNLFPYAFRSAVYPCLRTYSAYIENSVLVETIRSTTPLEVGDSGWSLAMNRTLRNGVWQPCDPLSTQTQSNPIAYPLPSTGQDPNITSSTRYYPEDCIFDFPITSKWPLNNVALMFDNQSLSGMNGPPAALGPAHLIILALNGTANPDSINDYLRDLTLSMTADIRTRGATDESKEWTQGEVTRLETCIHVQWAWLSFPIVLWILTVIFLTTLVIQTSPNAHASDENATVVPPWKSSELALLFYGLASPFPFATSDDNRNNNNGYSHDVSGRPAAGSTSDDGLQARLVHVPGSGAGGGEGGEEGGWRFVTSQPR